MKEFKENIQKYDAQLIQLKKQINKNSFFRLFVFIISATIIITLFSLNIVTPLFFIFPLLLILFNFLLKRHKQITFLKNHSEFLKEINESEIERQNCKLNKFDTGKQFINPEHPYSSDLDIFGQHSIYQLLNRTTTESGSILLAQWLTEPAHKVEIIDRQKAVKELTGKLDWRQNFQASGMHYQNKKSDFQKLQEWVLAPEFIPENKRKKWVAIAIILSILTLSSFYIFISNLVEINWYNWYFFILLIIDSIILKKFNNPIESIVKNAQANVDTLKGYQALILKIENENFQSSKLSSLKSLFTPKKQSASTEIKRLSKTLDFSQQKGQKGKSVGGNWFYAVLNSIFLIDIYMVVATENWKSRNKKNLKPWSDAISEFEVINSFAGFYYANSSYVLPEIANEDNFIDFKSLGHPLINSISRVCNDFHTKEDSNVIVVTGSNMAGKSTFLRTVGTNLVLALAGAPCCAEYAKVSFFRVFTSMRTHDNLKEGVSSFYAELSRVETLLNLIKNNGDIFCLLDEMFKGTNSKDRHKGGYSLINQITKLNTPGIIATHDIDLAKLLDEQSLVANYSFNSEIKNDSMFFSYKMIPGICNDFNASELMKKCGIEIIND